MIIKFGMRDAKVISTLFEEGINLGLGESGKEGRLGLHLEMANV